jgi:Carboxypeptidase regulatory-like domain
MSVTFRLITTLLLMIGGAGVTVHAQAPVKVVKKGSVAGKVTLKGKPAAGVTVGIRSSDFGMPFEPTYKAVTDLQGLYRISDIPPGSYQVAPLAPAYVLVNEPARGKALVLGEGESVDGLDFTIVRGGVVTGKVTDADGRPVIEQRVNLLKSELPPEQRRNSSVSSVMTDDRGIYRMFGLYPGRYVVSVGQGQDNFFNSAGTGRPRLQRNFSSGRQRLRQGYDRRSY